MRIVLAGGTGFIGRRLLARLAGAGDGVALLSREPDRLRAQLPPGTTAAAWDGQTPGAWAGLLDGADAVVNLAGEPVGGKRWTPRQKERIVRSRVGATRAIVEAIRAAARRPAVLINASAVGYYGPVEDGDVAEDHPPGSSFLPETCVRWEGEASAARDLGVRVVLLRFAVVLGNDGGALPRMLPAFRMFAGGPIGSGRQWFPWVHRDDAVGVVEFALRSDALRGPVNVVAPDPVTMAGFCATLGEVIRRPSWLRVPSLAVRALAGEMASVVLTGQRQVPRALTAAGYEFIFPRLRGALADLLR